MITQEQIEYANDIRIPANGQPDYLSKSEGKILLEIKNLILNAEEDECFCGSQESRLRWKHKFYLVFDEYIKNTTMEQ